jgi:hypothetical protein
MTRERRLAMKQIFVRSGLLVAALVVCQGGAVGAASMDVKVPFPFVVEGKTLPAGEYRVENNGGMVLIRGEKGNNPASFVLTTPAKGHDPAGDKPALTFSLHDDQYQLDGIWQSSSQGRHVLR